MSFEEISPEALQDRLQKSVGNSAEAWFYLGSDEAAHYLVAKPPGRILRMRVSRERVEIARERPFSANPATWRVFKIEDVRFCAPGGGKCRPIRAGAAR